MLACVNVESSAVKRRPGWWNHCRACSAWPSYSSPSDFQLKNSCLWEMQKINKNMFGSSCITAISAGGYSLGPLSSGVLVHVSQPDLQQIKTSWSVVANNCHSINTSTILSFNLSTWPHSMQSWEGMWSWPQDTRVWPPPQDPVPTPRSLLDRGTPLSEMKLIYLHFRREMNGPRSFCSHWFLYIRHFSLSICSPSTHSSGYCRNLAWLPTPKPGEVPFLQPWGSYWGNILF